MFPFYITRKKQKRVNLIRKKKEILETTAGEITLDLVEQLKETKREKKKRTARYLTFSDYWVNNRFEII